MGIKMSPKQFPSGMRCYVKYKEAEFDKLVDILKPNNCGVGGSGRPWGIQ